MHASGIDRIVLEPERRAITGVSRTGWWRFEKDGTAPRRIPISANRVGWALSELQSWVQARIAERDAERDAA